MNQNRNIQLLSRRLLPLLLLALATTLGACVKTVVHPPLDVTFLPERGDFVSKYGDQLSFDEIMQKMRNAEYILLGEGHTSVCDHKIQQRIVAALATSDRPPAIGLEMVAVDMQLILDDFAKGQITVADLEEELQWSTKWGYPYSLFSGLFEIANRNSLPVAGLNVPTAVTRKISREGVDALTGEERDLLPAEIVPPTSDQQPMLDMIFGQHASKDQDDSEQRERFHLVQSIWDSKMAEEAVRLRKKYDWPVLIIAGSGHVEYNWGIAMRIRRFDPGATIFSLVPWRGGEFDPEAGDAFFYCPDTYVSKMGATLETNGGDGLLVQRVTRGSRADKAGLRPGDVLVEASGVPLGHLFSLHMAGTKVHKANEELVFIVRRGGDIFSVSVGKLGQAKAQD